MTKNATVEKKTTARWTENASHKMSFTKPQSQQKHRQSHTWALPQILKNATGIITASFRHKSKRNETEQEDARRRLRGMCWCKRELPLCSGAMESWVVYATNVCRRDRDVLLRNNTLEDELHTRVPLLLKTKLTSILPPYMLGVWGGSLNFAFLY